MALSGCVGVFAGEPASASFGSHSRGALVHATAMPFEGTGYLIHKDWRGRDHRYATEEMVEWLTQVFAEVSRGDPEGVVYLGDLSGRQGGEVTKHRSHASGRDADIFFVASDSSGRVLRDLPAMLHFGADGRAVRWSPAKQGQGPKDPIPSARFDARRNWAVVRAMLSSPLLEVQWIFVDQDLAGLLLAEAVREGSPPDIVAKARALLHQPTDAQAHDDHMHVRVFCTTVERAFGCADQGPKRWLKKHWKYMPDGGSAVAAR